MKIVLEIVGSVMKRTQTPELLIASTSVVGQPGFSDRKSSNIMIDDMNRTGLVSTQLPILKPSDATSQG